ncbi:DUF6524 family protein [Pseudoroseicyclus sp. CXY001]|uniref:DUF6524 family protein n=1 Tax=Pseudoroseicyclus sp. CXY001 TaxID=3242492 RepID=UPI003571082C
MALQFFMRWGFAGLLVAFTYNPTQFNYLHWLAQNYIEQLPLAAVLGLALVIGYIVTLRATLRSLGYIGVVLVLAFVAAIVWLGLDKGWLSIGTRDSATWLGVFTASLVLGTGLSWSMVRRRISGQVDVDDADN